MAKKLSPEAAEAAKKAEYAATHTDSLGPGTSGHTISGAAYRGMEVASNTGAPSPDERGFSNTRKGKLADDGPA